MLAVISFAAAWLPGRIWPDGARALARRRARPRRGRARVRGRTRHRGRARRPSAVPFRVAAGAHDRRRGGPRRLDARPRGRHDLGSVRRADERLGVDVLVDERAEGAGRLPRAVPGRSHGAPGRPEGRRPTPASRSPATDRATRATSGPRPRARPIASSPARSSPRETGATSRLGHLLAPTGVRYVSFLTRAGVRWRCPGRAEPAPRGCAGPPARSDAVARSIRPGVVYENDAWIPMHASVPTNAIGLPLDSNDPGSATLRSDATGVKGVDVTDGTTPPIGPGSLLWSEAANGGWKASAHGKHRAPARRVRLDERVHARRESAGPRALRRRFRGERLAWLLQVAAWIAVGVLWFVTRRRRGQPRELQVVT